MYTAKKGESYLEHCKEVSTDFTASRMKIFSNYLVQYIGYKDFCEDYYIGCYMMLWVLLCCMNVMTWISEVLLDFMVWFACYFAIHEYSSFYYGGLNSLHEFKFEYSIVANKEKFFLSLKGTRFIQVLYPASMKER